jgi:predicted nucleotidyltransferase
MQETDTQETYVRWLKQSALRDDDNEERYQHAWEVAKKAAKLLRERYGVNRVRVFGSLTHKGSFHQGSDIDLAVEGLKISDYWEALTSVLFLDDQIFVEIADRAICRPELWKVVEQEGIDL